MKNTTSILFTVLTAAALSACGSLDSDALLGRDSRSAEERVRDGDFDQYTQDSTNCRNKKIVDGDAVTPSGCPALGSVGSVIHAIEALQIDKGVIVEMQENLQVVELKFKHIRSPHYAATLTCKPATKTGIYYQAPCHLDGKGNWSDELKMDSITLKSSCGSTRVYRVSPGFENCGNFDNWDDITLNGKKVPSVRYPLSETAY